MYIFTLKTHFSTKIEKNYSHSKKIPIFVKQTKTNAMKTYNEIKQEEIKRTEKYTKSDFDKSIKMLEIVKTLFSEGVFFVISLIPFLIGIFILNEVFLFAIILLFAHLIFYKKFAKGIYDEKIAPDKKSIDMVIQVLKDLKSEKYN
jgi:hypothetical protein